MSRDELKVSEKEMKCLKVLEENFHSDFNFSTFRKICRRTSFDLKTVRRSVRALARKGLAEFGKGLWTEDGKMAGAGYACTFLGHEFMEKQRER